MTATNDADSVRFEIELLKGSLEAQLDMVLAEELSVNPGFVDRFARRALASAGRAVPNSSPTSVKVTFNHWHVVADGFSGENDLDVELRWPQQTERLLVENKVWAPLQAEQAQRYRQRARHCDGAAVLVAPQAWLDTHQVAVAIFDGAHSIESLAGWLRDFAPTDVRLRWRAALLDKVASPKTRSLVVDHAPTIEFRDYCMRWLEERCPSAAPAASSLHTENQGWLWFRHPPDLNYKAVGGVVDLYVGAAGFSGTEMELRARLVSRPLPEGFAIGADSRGNLVLRCSVPKVRPSDGLPSYTADLLAGLEACSRIVDWFEAGGDQALRDGSGCGPTH